MHPPNSQVPPKGDKPTRGISRAVLVELARLLARKCAQEDFREELKRLQTQQGSDQAE